MLKEARYSDRERVVEILTDSFESNASVNYIVKQDDRRMERIRTLMEYSVKVCAAFGKVVISDDRNAAALVMCKRKGFGLRPLVWDLQLIFGVTGAGNVRKVLRREALVKAQHPLQTFYYLWFIGVHPAHKGFGAGSELLAELIADAEGLGMDMYLETSAAKNIPWYEKFGFRVFHEIDVGYRLLFLKRVSAQKTASI